MLKTLEKNKMKIFKLNRCPEYFTMEKEELSEETKEEVALCRWLKKEIAKRRDKKTKKNWEGTAPEDYLVLTKENRRLVKLRRDYKVVGHILAKRTGIGMFNKHKLKIGKDPVICKCRIFRERGHFLEYKLAKHNI